MNYEAKLKAGKAADLATLAAHGVHLPASVDAVVLCNAARAVATLALRRDELAAELIGRIELLAPIAKRDTDIIRRAKANASLREAYARLAELQRAGVTIPALDIGAL